MARRNFIIRLIISAVVLGLAIYLGWRSADEGIWAPIASLSPGVLATVFIALVFNLLMAALRFGVISAHFGSSFRAREAIAIVSASSVAGALFFQLAGQLMARGAMMSRFGGSLSSAVIVTTNERIAGALVSLIGAMVGAFIIFGGIYFDLNSGASELVKLVGAGIAAASVGVWLSGAAPVILPKFNARTARLWGITIVLSVGVQIPMMAAYIIAAKSLAPDVPMFPLLGATLIIMFAASVPVSFGGWGVRELSAVGALGAIGLASAKALVVALMIGIGSMLVAGLGAAATLPSLLLQAPRREPDGDAQRRTYARVLFTAIPVLTAIAVLFQVYLPVRGNRVNVNLADPLALAGGVLFLVSLVTFREPARWRYRYVNAFALAALAILTMSLFLGAEWFGFTTWAVTNRYLGWFVLMAYAATGALIVAEQSKLGAVIIAKAYLAATAAVASVDFILACINMFHALGEDLISPAALRGMAQNRNAFAFQILIALALSIGLRLYRRRALAAASTIVAVALILTFSRSGTLTFFALATVPLLGGAPHARRIAMIAVASAAVALIAFTIFGDVSIISRFIIDPRNVSERLLTLEGGFRLFLDHPLFGAGLGAFQNQGHKSFEGLPLVIHSTFVWLLAETGIAGFAVFMFAAGYALKREVVTLSSDRVSAAIVLLLAVMIIMGLPADMLYQRTFWLFIGALIAIPVTVTSDSRRTRRVVLAGGSTPPLAS